MAVQGKVEPLERDVALIIDRDLSPDAQSRALAGFAREALAEGQDTNYRSLGRVPPHRTFVDGVAGASVDRVRPAGIVVYEFELVSDVLMFIMGELRKVSPVRSGRYRESHDLFADGVEVPVAGGVQIIKPADEYVFLSALPYARKIEGGKGRKPLSKQAPKGVYEITAAKARRRFSNVARVRFSFRAPLAGAITAYRPSGSPGASRSRRRGSEHSNRVPAIVVTLR